MRHRKKKGRLSRNSSLRKATLKSLANALFTYQRIETTFAKAKALRGFVEPLITLAKNDPKSVSAKRRAFQKLCDKDTVKELFDAIAPLYKTINGGYTRIMMLGRRRGDGAQMSIIELTKRTVSDDELLGKPEKKKAEEKTKAKKEDKKAKKAPVKEEKAPVHEDVSGHKTHRAPEVDIVEKEERVVEDVRKEKAKTEQKKLTKSGGIFKRFQRKSMG